MTKKRKVTPIRKQYLEIKSKYPDAILFFRLGDFYETFDEDAEITSRELDIVLTSRKVGKGNRVPMAGIPHHAAENYLSRLIEKGFHVAICEQVGEQPEKGIFPRKVTRVVTPGTVVEAGLLPGDENNYLACVVMDTTSADSVRMDLAGLAYVDISTGEFAVTQILGKNAGKILLAELERINPSEVLRPESLTFDSELPGNQTEWPDWRFEPGRCQEKLLRHFDAASLDGFGLRNKPMAVRAAGTVLQYVSETQSLAVKLLSGLSTYYISEFMHLDSYTRSNLELTKTMRDGSEKDSLLGVIDNTVTPMGKRFFRRWISQPLLDVDQINDRLDQVDFFFSDGMLRAEFKNEVKSINDIERLTNRIISGVAQPRDLTALRSSLRLLPKIKNMFPDDDSPLSDMISNFNLCEKELELLENAITEDPPATLQNIGVIRRGYADELDGILDSSQEARDWIADLEGIERKRTGIKSLKVGFNKVFGYYLEVTKANTERVPDEYIRKQTLVNSERYITPELKEYETKVLNSEERIKEIEKRLFREVCARLAGSAERLLGSARVIAKLDVLAALAEAAAINGYIRPEVVDEDVLEICDGRHPVVEKTLSGERFVANDITFEEGERIRIITGPNMSGKSTALRQTALIVLMAQMGSYIPASSAKIGLVDRIFTRMGAQDEIHAGQSTFMVEMVETANILHNATPRSLLVLDEIGRGTSTYDGVSIAWAVVEYIHNHPDMRAKTLFATHYHELTQLSELLPGVRNYNVAVSEADDKVVFLHKIVAGGSDRSYGIHVGQLAGLPPVVVQRAGEILHQLEASSGKAVKIDPSSPKQLAMFPKTNPLVDELKNVDINSLSPIEALNKLYDWQKRFIDEKQTDRQEEQ